MKTKLLFLLILCTIGSIVNAQINVSTGLNSAGASQTICGTDFNWKLVSSTSGIAKVTAGITGAWESTPVAVTNAGWINVTCNPTGETSGIYIFERDFTILPATASFSCNFRYACDDNINLLELIAPGGSSAFYLAGPVIAPYHLLDNPAVTNVISAPAAGVWKIRATVRIIDHIGAFLISGYINPAPVVVQDSTVYCCTGTNLFNNGNFEAGNVGFTSSYTFQPAATANAVIPRQYNVVNNAQAAATSPQWVVQDHTKCINGASNSKFLVVNGRTMQSAGTSSVIWDETVTVNPANEYKFCANFKNMPQCAFDIKPQIRIVLTGGNWTTGSSAYQTIITPASPCGWMQVSGCITPTGQQLRVQIFLLEDGIGDGNDLAMDDISLQQKIAQPSYLSLSHNGSPTVITGSLNSIANTDDILTTTGCGTQNAITYQWYVYEVTAAPGFPMVPGTNAWSTNISGYNNQTSSAVGPWALTTTFPGYIFTANKLYLVGLYIPSCCNSCYADKWMYQITGYFGFTTPPQYEMTDKMKAYIKAMIKESNTTNPASDKPAFRVTPNPTNGKFQVAFDTKVSGTIDIIDPKGTKIGSKTINNEKLVDFDLSNNASGIYFIQMSDGDKVYSQKVVKQ